MCQAKFFRILQVISFYVIIKVRLWRNQWTNCSVYVMKKIIGGNLEKNFPDEKEGGRRKFGKILALEF